MTRPLAQPGLPVITAADQDRAEQSAAAAPPLVDRQEAAIRAALRSAHDRKAAA